MTKTQMLTAGRGGDHIADLHLLSGHDDSIDEQFDQQASLFKSGLLQPHLHPLAEGSDRGRQRGHIALLLQLDLQQMCLLLDCCEPLG
jgi:hypothetical protein